MKHINIPDHVENADKYRAAAIARIKNNAYQTKKRKWIATPEGKRVNDYIFELDGGEFARIYDEDGQFKATNAVVKASWCDFAQKMRDIILEYGALSPAQTAAMIKVIERGEQRVKERGERRAEKAATAQHVGTVGKRETFDVRIVFVTSFEGMYGWTYITGMEDAQGNVIVQKGAPIGEKGDEIKIKATVKEHGERDGIKQTIVCRTKVLGAE